MEDRLIELETRVEFQDDLIRKLRTQVDLQEATLYKLGRELGELRELLADQQELVGAAKDEPPPPHY